MKTTISLPFTTLTRLQPPTFCWYRKNISNRWPHQRTTCRPAGQDAAAGTAAGSGTKGLDNGFRTAINTGKGGGQEVMHLHLHVFGGGKTGKMAEVLAKL